MKPIDVDANGLPVGHREALEVAVDEFHDYIHELPETPYHFRRDDCVLPVERMIHRYLRTLIRTQQQARVLSLVER